MLGTIANQSGIVSKKQKNTVQKEQCSRRRRQSKFLTIWKENNSMIFMKLLHTEPRNFSQMQWNCHSKMKFENVEYVIFYFLPKHKKNQKHPPEVFCIFFPKHEKLFFFVIVQKMEGTILTFYTGHYRKEKHHFTIPIITNEFGNISEK